MKYFFLFFLLSIYLIYSQNIITIPSQEEIFNYYSIQISKEIRQFVLTDRKDGVYLGKTFYNRSGEYKINDYNTFKDFVVFENGNYLNFEKAKEAIVYPYGISYKFDNCETLFSILQNENGVLLSVKGVKENTYSIFPSIVNAKKGENVTFEKYDGFAIFIGDDEKNLYRYTSVIYDNAIANFITKMDEETISKNNLTKTAIYAGGYNNPSNVKLIILFDKDKDELIKKSRLYKGKYNELEKKVKDFFYDMLTRCYAKTDNDLYNRALGWAIISGNSMVNTRYSGMGIYAGFPWFQQNWGRDTFISLPGISIVTGRFEEAKQILKTFSDYQNREVDKKMYGRIPNRVMDKSIIYNTTDGTPWMIREAYEYLQYSNDTTYAKQMFEVAKIAIEGALKNFVDEEGFLTHDDADTWMDARIAGKQPWSPRGNRAVEIQALWYNQLLVSAKLATLVGEKALAREWEELANKVKTNFLKRFWNTKQLMLFDRITEDNKPDRRIRPNQLMAITVPFQPILPDDLQPLVVKNTISKLLFPYGILSLDQKDPYFHPYHESPMYHKDSAYHNGTIWGWNGGLAVHCLTEFSYQTLAFDFSLNLADQIINQGCIGSMSENMDAFPQSNGKVKLTGTYSQAWSVSEFARNFYQNFAGIRPNLLENSITIKPKIPSQLKTMEVIQRINHSGQIQMKYSNGEFTVQFNNLDNININFVLTNIKGEEYLQRWTSSNGKIYKIKLIEDGVVDFNGEKVQVIKIKDSYYPVIGKLEYAKQEVDLKKIPSMKKKDFLKEIILKDKYKLPK